jgi:hypothetical protein
MSAACTSHERSEMNVKFQPENLKGRDHLEGLGVDGEQY